LLNSPIINNAHLYRSVDAYQRMQSFYDSQLALLQVPYQTRYIDTRHGKTYVLTAGDPANPPLVLWHGMNANLVTWVPQINLFATRFYVIAPDTVGDAGRSDPRRLDRKSPAYGEWAADVLNALNIQRAHMIGISGGGWMILRLATFAPEVLRSAVLMSSAGFFPISNMILVRVLPWLLFSSPENAARRFLKVMSPPNFPITQEAVTAFVLLMPFKAQTGLYVFTDDEIRQLNAPTMLLMGQYEATCDPHKVIERARRLIPNLCRAELVPGVGHGMTGENPDEVHRRIFAFLDEVDRTSA